MGQPWCVVCNWTAYERPRRNFYRFPKDKVRRQKWLDYIGKSQLAVSSGALVCEWHFEHFNYTDAVPTLNLRPYQDNTNSKDDVEVDGHHMCDHMLLQVPLEDKDGVKLEDEVEIKLEDEQQVNDDVKLEEVNIKLEVEDEVRFDEVDLKLENEVHIKLEDEIDVH